MWDLYDGELSELLQAHYKGADSVAFAPGGTLLASGGRDNQIMLWDVDDAEQLGILTGNTKPVLAFNPSGTLLASGSGDNTVRLWHVPGEGA